MKLKDIDILIEEKIARGEDVETTAKDFMNWEFKLLLEPGGSVAVPLKDIRLDKENKVIIWVGDNNGL